HATNPILMGGSYATVKVDALVTDPDSTPGNNDVATVTSDLTLSTGTTTLPLFDDGSAATTSATQVAGVGEDCTNGQSCVCLLRPYATRSGDATALDSHYTRARGLLAPAASPYLSDCAMLQNALMVQPAPTGDSFTLHVDATDRNNHHASWTGPLQGTVAPSSVSCTGDVCGCCLINSADPLSECRGLAGMPSTGAPLGICMSL